MHRSKSVLLIMLLVFFLFVGCTKTESQTPTSLKVGMMSAIDAAPFYLALDKGYYAEAGVDVELLLFTNGQNRQTALQTRQVDGAMTDLVALITQTASDFRLVGTLSTDGDFPLLVRQELFDKQELRIGTMEISVTNYLVDKYVGEDRMVEKVFINEIPARLEAVASGNLDGGIFPEPFASVGAQRGLKKLIFHDIPAESLNIMAFTQSSIEKKADAIKRFNKAYEKAVDEINRNPQLARDMVVKYIPNVPSEVAQAMHLPTFHAPRLPSDAFMQQIMDWTTTVTKKPYTFQPSSMVDRQFVEGL